MKYTVWKWSDSKGDWRKIKTKRPWQKQARTSINKRNAQRLQKKWKKRGAIVTVRKSSSGAPLTPPKGKRFSDPSKRKWATINMWLSGDLDAKTDLLHRIALTARKLRKPLYVAEGKRSVADQWKYWWAYKRGQGPLAAYPGTSNHTWGDAADVREHYWKGSRNIGEIPGARQIMDNLGLHLPVPGESWHVEKKDL